MNTQFKENQTSTSKLTDSKKQKVLKQMLAIFQQLDQEMYVCIKDKKTGKAAHFSTDKANFGIEQVQIQANKPVLDFDQFSKTVNKLAKKLRTSTQSNDSTTETKAQTTASCRDMHTLVDSLSHTDLVQSDNDRNFFSQKPNFMIFDQKSFVQFGDQRLSTMLNPSSFSCMDLHSELSFQPARANASTLFTVNQESYNSIEDSSDQFDDSEVENLQFSQPSSKKFQEDDFGLRVDSTQRRTFAQQYLHKSENKTHKKDLFYDEDASYSYENSAEIQMSNENSNNYSLAKHTSTLAMISEELFAENSEEEMQASDDDMFFCCADWETQIKKEFASKNEEFSDVEEYLSPKKNKRQAKAASKVNTPVQPELEAFDIDQVMRCVPNQSAKVLPTKRYFSDKKMRVKSFQKTLEVSTKRESGDEQPFKDLCLSPLSRRCDSAQPKLEGQI